MKYLLSTLTLVSLAGIVCAQPTFPWEAQSPQNFIVTTTIAREGVTPETNLATLDPSEYATTIRYYDGLGRPVQTVAFGQSPEGKDVVVPVVYDAFGREAVKYLPYARDGRNGSYVATAVQDQGSFYATPGTHANDVAPFAKTIFENSPLNRVLEQGAPGAAWQPGTTRTVKMSYEFNAANEVRIWTISYPSGYSLGIVNSTAHYNANQLYRNRTVDEHDNAVVEYVDKQGRTVLKRVQVVTGTPSLTNAQKDTNWASTYYIYDDFGQLVCVIPPEATKRLSAEYFQSGASNASKDTFLERWAFRYKYDERKRMTLKQVPGADAVYMVYDKRDRLVLTQDGNQRPRKEWLFTKYDALNRPVMTGIYTHGTVVDQVAMSGLIDNTNFFETYNGNSATHGYSLNVFPKTNLEVLTVTYYDNYDFLALAGTGYNFQSNHLSGQKTAKNEYVKGQVTGSKTRVLGSSTFLWAASYYDDKYRPIQGVATNPRGNGTDRTTSIYDFVGKVLKTRTTSEGNTITRTFEYDHAGRLLLTRHKVNNVPEVVLSANYYNELGELVTKGLHHKDYPPVDDEIGEPGTVHAASIQRSTYSASEADLIATQSVVLKPGFHVPAGSSFSARIGFTKQEAHATALTMPNGFRQVVDYRYNIRGWLNTINDPDAPDPGDLFSMKLNYNTPTAQGGDPQYNGNISQIFWRSAGQDKQSYGYKYDPMNRLLSAWYRNHTNPAQHDRYNEAIGDLANGHPAYDLNGNILRLRRSGKKNVASGQGSLDYLQYYYIGNQLHVVNDSRPDNPEEAGFKELVEKTFNATNPSTWEYTYDANGNMIRDDNKGITSIEYNHLNLPAKVSKSASEYIVYTYDATGRKLRQQVFGPQAKVTDYAGELIFQNDTLQFINTEEGRVVVTGAEPEYQYHLKDHLGSIRTTFSETHMTEEFVATLESATNDDFLNHNNRSSFTPYNHTPSGTYSQLLNGGYNGQVGLAKSFAVEPGDVFDLEVYAKYEAPTSTSADPSTLLAGLFSTFSLGTGGTGLESQAAADGFNAFFGSDNIWIDDDMYDPSVPRAYLNYILFDEDFIPVDFGFSQVTDAGATAHELLNLHVKVERKGYLYVYLSNEQTVRTNVYFDDLRIVKHTGVVQVDDYYPFGMTYNSFKREDDVANRWKFQGQEHIDELDLGWDSFKWRNHQPDIGRFFNIDPIAEEYYYNSPYAFSENKVTAHVELEGLESKYFMDRRSSVENTDPYLNTDRQGRQIEVTRYNGLGEENGRATVTMSGNVDASKVTDRSAAVIGEIAIASGESNVRVSSVARDAEDQARAMFTNLEGSGPGQGIPAQRRLYGGKPGGEVIKTYTKAKGLQALANQFGGTVSNEQVKGMMESKINELGVQNVTRHASDDPTINVLDIAPSSVQNTKQFVEAGKEHPRVQKFIPYPKDPGHHFEIKQD